jgi:hypothetical protein
MDRGTLAVELAYDASRHAEESAFFTFTPS